MQKLWIAALFIALALGGIAFLTTENIYVTAAVPVVTIAYYFVFLAKPLKKYDERVLRVHECYDFINSFLITMSVKSSLGEAFASATQNPSKPFKVELSQLEAMDVPDKLVYLRKYFNLGIYKLFVNVVNLHQEQGGDILALGEPIMQETVRMEDYVKRTAFIGKKKAGEFAALWLMTFGVLLIMRFGISEFYGRLVENAFFLVLISLFFLVFILSIHIFVSRYVALSIKEDRLDG